MLQNLCFKSQFLLLRKHLLVVQPIDRSAISLGKPQFRRSVICAAKKRRRNGSQKWRRFELRLASILASRIGILSPPLDMVVGDLDGADGRWPKDLNGFARSLSFGGWKVSRRRNNWFLLWFSGLVVMFLKTDLKIEAVIGVLGFGYFAASVINKCKRIRLKDLVFAVMIFLFGLLMGFSFKGDDQAITFMQRNRFCSSVVEILGKGKKIGGHNSSGRRL